MISTQFPATMQKMAEQGKAYGSADNATSFGFYGSKKCCGNTEMVSCLFSVIQ
jgi:hypothetical protein